MQTNSPQLLPGLSQPGAIPPRYLNSNERILFESRPRWISVVGLALLIWLVISTVFASSLAGALPGAAGGIFLLWFVIGGPLTLMVRTLRWRDKFYGLTDQRILKGSGVGEKKFESITIKRTSGMMDVNTARVTGVGMDQKVSGRLFGYGLIVFRTNIGEMHWDGVRRPFDVRRYVEETLSQVQDAAGTELTYRDEITRTAAKIGTEQRMGFRPQQAPYAAPSSSQQVPSMGSQTLQSLPSPTMLKCSKCDTSYPAGTKFCSNCGSPLQPMQPLEA